MEKFSAKKSTRSLFIAVTAFVLIAIIAIFIALKNAPDSTLISVNEFKKLLNMENKPSNLVVDDGYVVVESEGKKYRVARDFLSLSEIGGDIVVESKSEFGFLDLLSKIGIGVIALLGLAVLFRAFKLTFSKGENNLESSRIQAQNLTPSTTQNLNATAYITPTKSAITFAQVAGIKDVKDDLLEIIDYLKNPKKYRDLGLSLPRGVLLVGPPGVGKTLIAKAVAGEIGVPFFYQSGSSFAQIFVGAGAKRVAELFAAARAHAPSVIFIDEIDALGKARGGNRNDERESTLNQLLTEMDGFEDSSGVIVIAATNKIEVMDEALLRSGRFDRRIHIALPDIKEREQILSVHLANKKHALDIGEVAKMCVGFSGATLASLINEAGLNALRRKSERIEMSDILSVKERVIGGKKRSLTLSQKEREVLAIYQGAKALSAHWLGIEFSAFNLVGDSAISLDKAIFSKSEMLNLIKVALSGSVALNLKYKESYSNASKDIALAKEMALKMCEKYGMGAHICYESSDEAEILEFCSESVESLLQSYASSLNLITDCLLKNEKISKEEVAKLVTL